MQPLSKYNEGTAVNADNGRKNVVLVHGICTDGSVWRRVIPMLQQQGVEVTAAQIPNTTLEDDIGTVRRTLDMQKGMVTLVGHSYAGMVISGIGKHESVKNLVYIAALAPEEHETVLYLMAKEPAAYALEPISDEAGYSWPPADAFTAGLAHDADPSDQQLLWATRKSFGGILFSSTVSAPVWKQKPSWYLVSGEDRILHPSTQHFMARRIRASTTEVPTSHFSPITRPEAVADMILQAASAG